MIQYDDDLVAAHTASQPDADAGGNVANTGVTRFDLAEHDDSLQSSMVDLDLNLLPLDAKILPQEAIRNHYQHLPRRAGPRHRSGYNTDTIRSNHSAKSVTIANQVTEFHYSGETDQACKIPTYLLKIVMSASKQLIAWNVYNAVAVCGSL